jgi:hypothetical protein
MSFTIIAIAGVSAGCVCRVVVSKLKCPVLLASEVSDFIHLSPAVVAVGMWESQAAFWPDFSKPRWEATGLVAFLGGVISIAGWPSAV